MTVSGNDHQDSSAVPASPALAFYGKMLTFSRLQFSTDDLGAIEAQLAKTLSNKSSNIPVLIDSEIEQNLSALVELLWSWGLQPIGVITGLLDLQAREQRLAIFPADGKRIERICPIKAPLLTLAKYQKITAQTTLRLITLPPSTTLPTTMLTLMTRLQKRR